MPERLDVIYQDAALVAVHKPSGLLVHRSEIDRRETRFALHIVRDQLGARVYPVHRLDKGTSGVLLFARDARTAARLSADFEAGAVAKTYLAVVRGHPPELGEIDHPLSRMEDPYAGHSVDAAPQSALTRYRRLAVVELPYRVDKYPSSRYALLRLEPVTGRRHQLRRHMKHIAHPIIGDATHGKGRHNRLFQTLYGCDRLLLACVEMRLPHPVSGEPLLLTAPIGGRFARVLAQLGWRDALPDAWWRDPPPTP